MSILRRKLGKYWAMDCLELQRGQVVERIKQKSKEKLSIEVSMVIKPQSRNKERETKGFKYIGE